MTHRHRLRVHWEDTDAGGIVYHANYLKFAERARSEMVRAQGVAQAELAAGGHALAVVHVGADFLAPARLDDELDVESRVRSVGGASMELDQTIRRADGTPLVRLDVRLGFIALEDGRPARMPAQLKRVLLDLADERRN